ncbi:unnamed protein product [Phytophthora lilii]|uniref:Unnamed protein product n=1 Tax=Phytophthora lilii TaxID=2077276 RepID=A0A9W6X4L8_9STRA|nr:unnamed protein product [Phytophthora lilii]
MASSANDSSSNNNSSSAAARPKEVAPFLRSLRQMLDSESPAILRWTADGTAFEIHDMAAMMRLVLPKYFKHAKYTSFQRQLNYFSFRKWTKSKAVVCTFSNPFFQRDQPALAGRITRKKSLHATDAKRSESPRRASGSGSGNSTDEVATSKPSAATPKKSARTKKLTRRAPTPMAIKLPAGEASSPASFPSPTDAFALDLSRVYGEVAEIRFHEPLAAPGEADAQSLDWVDALYSSLEPLLDDPAYPSFRDHAFDYAEL